MGKSNKKLVKKVPSLAAKGRKKIRPKVGKAIKKKMGMGAGSL